MVKCSNCNKRISRDRLEVFPDTKYCVKCVDHFTEKIVGITVWDKMTPTTVLVSKSQAEEYKRTEQIDSRLGRLK